MTTVTGKRSTATIFDDVVEEGRHWRCGAWSDYLQAQARLQGWALDGNGYVFRAYGGNKFARREAAEAWVNRHAAAGDTLCQQALIYRATVRLSK